MMTRKMFLRRLPAIAAVPALGPLSLFLDSCAPSGLVYHASASGGRVTIPASALSGINDSGSYARVYIDKSPNPVFVFRAEGAEIVAMLSTCSHRGCEVKKLRNGFECPCHGSEYDLDGNVKTGPAVNPLKRFDVTKMENDYVLSVAGNQ